MDRQYRVLLIDDEPDYLDVYRNFLEKRGFHVETAADGAEGLDKLRQGDFDVAIIDLTMPKLSGLDVARKASEEGIDASLIILTGHGEKEDVMAALNLHVDYWFQKQDLDLEDLAAKLAELAEGMPLDKVRKLLTAVPSSR